MAWNIWVQDCALGAANPLCNEVFVKNGIAEFNSARLAQDVPVLVFDNLERDDATPWFERVGKLTYCGAPRCVSQFREMHLRQRFQSWTCVPRACARCSRESNSRDRFYE